MNRKADDEDIKKIIAELDMVVEIVAYFEDIINAEIT